VTPGLREAQPDQFSETAVDFTEDAEVDEIDEAILSALEVQPFGSVRDIARLTRLARSTVHWHLPRSLGFLVRHLRGIPHVLTEQQKRIRVSNSEQLLAIFQEQQGSSWRDFVTLEESWFYLRTDHERIWLAPGRTPPGRERHTIQSPKFMLTIVWGATGFHLVKLLPKGGGGVNASYYTTEILSEIVRWRNEGPETAGHKLIVHSDNARPHTATQTRDFSEAYGMDQAPHPPYSPDLAPSGFYLFGYLKERLQGQ
jgi:histone-lysine N-methyltransferase SETMAR